MINIKEEIQIALLRSGLSMRKLVKIMNENGYKIPAASNLSVLLSRKRVRFETVQEILEFLNYEIEIKRKIL